MQEQQTPNDPPKQIRLGELQAKVRRADYWLVPNTTTTVCALTLENGFVLIGESACVDPSMFNGPLGEQIAYQKAFEQLWKIEGYLLKQRRFEAGV